MAQQFLNGQLVDMSPEDEAAFEAERTPTLAEAKGAAITMAWNTCEVRIEAGQVDVTTSAGTHAYGIDRISQENIKSVLLGVALNVTPDPRPWTPRGELAPVSLSHADLTLVGATMMAAVDAEVQAYLAHKAAIAQLATVAEVLDYDLTTGWPA